MKKKTQHSKKLGANGAGQSSFTTLEVEKEAAKRIECPMLHLWAEGGPLDTFYTKEEGSLGIWRQWAPKVQ